VARWEGEEKSKGGVPVLTVTRCISASSGMSCRSGFSRDLLDLASRLKPLPQCNCQRSCKLAGGIASQGMHALALLFPPSGALQKNGETKAPGDVPAGRGASGTGMCHVRFRHDTDVCRNRRAPARRGGASQRKSEPNIRTPRRALSNPNTARECGRPAVLGKPGTS